MSLTKEQVSDLKSLHEEVIRCTVAHAAAASVLDRAKAQLANYLWQLENGKSGETR